MKKYLTVKETAELLRVSEKTSKGGAKSAH